MKYYAMGTSMLLALAVSAGLATAQTTTPTFESAATTGMVSLMPSTQTAQLNVLNTAGVPASTTTTTTTPVAACPVDLEFLDAQGTVRKSLQVANLAPGTAASLTFSLSDIPAGTVVFRLEIRGVVKSNPIVTGPIAAGTATMIPFSTCPMMTTLELFDTTTGITQALTSDTRPFATALFVPLTSPH
jgi:hypothetical protein